MYVHHIQSFYILLFKYIATYIFGLIVRRQGGLVHVAPVVGLLGEEHGGDREGGGRYQGVVNPGVADLWNEEQEQEDNGDKVVEGGQEAPDDALVDRVGDLH